MAGTWSLHKFFNPKAHARSVERSAPAAHSATEPAAHSASDSAKEGADVKADEGEDVERHELIEEGEADMVNVQESGEEEAKVLAPGNVARSAEDGEDGHCKSAQGAAAEPSAGGLALKLVALAAVALTASTLFVVGARGAWSRDGGSEPEIHELRESARSGPVGSIFAGALRGLPGEKRQLDLLDVLLEPPPAQEGILWEVTAGLVDVRDRPGDGGRQLGTKEHGARFFGDIGSGWINLTRESGFVKVFRGGSYQVSIVNRTECSDAGEDCSSSKCCRWPGHTCFKKHEGHARCRARCTKGPDPTDVDGRPWSCEPLGTPAAGEPEEVELPVAAWVKDGCTPSGGWSCKATMCCSEPGFQCFEHDEGNATCEKRCRAATAYRFSRGSDWCWPLGGRTPEAGSGALMSFPLPSEQ